MSVFLFKSLLSVAILGVALAAMYTMFEVSGRTSPDRPVEGLTRLHRMLGALFVALWLAVSGLCVGFMFESRAELTSRGALHSVMALAVFCLLALKSLFVRVYRQYYAYAKTIGITVGVTAIVTVGLTAGYHFTVTKFGTDLRYDRSAGYRVFGFVGIDRERAERIVSVRTDRRSIELGQVLFWAKCAICHDAESAQTIVGPGLKGLLRNPSLPVSGLPATPQNVMHQLKQPMGRMPSFAYLTDEEMADLLAYLNTL